jgi:hypothetical protein
MLYKGFGKTEPFFCMFDVKPMVLAANPTCFIFFYIFAPLNNTPCANK